MPIVRQGDLHRPAAGEAVIRRLGQQLGREERVADAAGEQRVLVMARVAHRRPSRPMRGPEVVRQAAAPAKRLLTTSVPQLLGELRSGALHGAGERLLEVSANRVEPVARPGDVHRG